jgi:hypothetical protein
MSVDAFLSMEEHGFSTVFPDFFPDFSFSPFPAFFALKAKWLFLMSHELFVVCFTSSAI